MSNINYRVGRKDDVEENASDINRIDEKVIDIELEVNETKRLLSLMNPTQSTRVDITTAAQTVALPKTAGIGPVKPTIKGLTVTNLMPDGNFTNTTGWTPLNSQISAANNIFTVTGDGTSNLVRARRSINVKWLAANKYYLVVKFRVTNSDSTLVSMLVRDGTGGTVLTELFQGSPVANTWYTKGAVLTIGAETANNIHILFNATYADATTANGKVMEVDGTNGNGVRAINLTYDIGAGNEPDADTCALLFPTYFDGTKSVIAPRLRSVGKNLLNPYEIARISDYVDIYSDGGETVLRILGISPAFKQLIPIKCKPLTQYTAKYTMRNLNSGKNVRFAFMYTDGTTGNIAGDGTTSYATRTTLSDASKSLAGLTIDYTSGDYAFYKISDFQIEEGSTATTYEPYTDLSALYTEPLPLRSNATDQDTITPTDGRMIYQQRIDPSTYATLDPLPAAVEVATSGILQSYPSGTIYAEHALADAGLYTTSIGVLNTDFPIESLESLYIVDPITGVKTALDHTTTTIAGDGLSFTHAGLTSGDIVFFTYFYAFSGVWGANVYSHFDGSMVVADTANSKFYSWKISSTNGVASIVLTEVI